MSFKYVFVIGILSTLLLLSDVVNSNPVCSNEDSNCKSTTVPTNPWLEACKEYSKIVEPHHRSYRHTSNGSEVQPHEFPFIALIGLKDKSSGTIRWVCGGTLISPSWVLTAAMCVMNDNKSLVVRLGEHDYSTADSNTQDFENVNITIPDDFDWEDYKSNIALIKLNTNATLNSNVLPACLPITNTTEYKSYQEAGVEYSQHPSTKFLKAKIVPSNLCSEMLDASIDNDICAVPDKDSASTSVLGGSPLFVPHPSIRGMYQVVGISSHSFSSCNEITESGDVCQIFYKRVFHFMTWINQQIKGI